MSMMVSFVLSFFPRDVLDEILNLIESVSEDFPSYSYTALVIKLSFGRFLIKVSCVLPDATVTFTTEIQPSLIFHVGDNTDWLYFIFFFFFFSFYLFIFFKCNFSFNIKLLGNKCHLGKESPLHCIGAKKSLLKASPIVNLVIASSYRNFCFKGARIPYKSPLFLLRYLFQS